jgi:mono/diheme cytochrome c family protein
MNRVQSLLIIYFVGVSALTCTKKAADQKQNEEEKEKLAADSVNHLVKRGKYLAQNVAACFYCHSQRDYNSFSGPVVAGTEGMGGQKFDQDFRNVPGVIFSRNISPSAIGRWSTDEIIHAITQGVSQNGDTLYPLMPYFHFSKMARGDLLSIIAFLRTITPIQNEVPKRRLQIKIRQAVPSLPSNTLDQNSRPEFADRVKYGEYLVNIADCIDCHTPMEKNNLITGKEFSGGLEFKVSGFTVRSANITPDSITGIGTWTEEVFLSKFTQYRSADSYQYNPGKNNSVMPWTSFGGMDDFDLKAIYAYLRILKPVKNKVIKNP